MPKQRQRQAAREQQREGDYRMTYKGFGGETEEDKCVRQQQKGTTEAKREKKYGNKRRNVQRAEKLEHWLNIHKG